MLSPGFRSAVHVLARAVNLECIHCKLIKKMQNGFITSLKTFSVMSVHHFCLVEFWIFMYVPLGVYPVQCVINWN